MVIPLSKKKKKQAYVSQTRIYLETVIEQYMN